MLRFSHMDTYTRSKLSRILTLVFVFSIFVHGVLLVSTAIWLSIVNVTGCKFLQKYYVPIFLQLSAGVCSLGVAAISTIFTVCQRTSSFVRLFLFAIFVIIAFEFACIISAAILNSSRTDNLEIEMLESISRTTANSTEEYKPHVKDNDCWNRLQDSNQCCGASSYSNWCPSAINYTECSDGNTNWLKSCECQSACRQWEGKSIYSDSCYGSISEKLQRVYKVNTILCSVLFVLQIVTYWALYCILPRLHSKAIVDTYKPKPTIAESCL